MLQNKKFLKGFLAPQNHRTRPQIHTSDTGTPESGHLLGLIARVWGPLNPIRTLRTFDKTNHTN